MVLHVVERRIGKRRAAPPPPPAKAPPSVPPLAPLALGGVALGLGLLLVRLLRRPRPVRPRISRAAGAGGRS